MVLPLTRVLLWSSYLWFDITRVLEVFQHSWGTFYIYFYFLLNSASECYFYVHEHKWHHFNSVSMKISKIFNPLLITFCYVYLLLDPKQIENLKVRTLFQVFKYFLHIPEWWKQFDGIRLFTEQHFLPLLCFKLFLVTERMRKSQTEVIDVIVM